MQPRVLALGILVIALMGAAWEVAVDALHVHDFLLPRPSAIVGELLTHLPLYLSQMYSTLVVTVIGFGLAAVVGILAGTAIAYSWVLRGLMYPPILVLQVVPKVALAPLLMVWVGY